MNLKILGMQIFQAPTPSKNDQKANQRKSNKLVVLTDLVINR
jgi:hypothetical protein